MRWGRPHGTFSPPPSCLPTKPEAPTTYPAAPQVSDELGETPRDILVQLGAKAAEAGGSGSGGGGGYGRLVSELDLLARVATMRDAGEQEAGAGEAGTGAGAGGGGDGGGAKSGVPAAWTLRAMRSLLAAAGGPGRTYCVRCVVHGVCVLGAHVTHV